MQAMEVRFASQMADSLTIDGSSLSGNTAKGDGGPVFTGDGGSGLDNRSSDRHGVCFSE